MRPKQERKSAAAPRAPDVLDALFPPWEDARGVRDRAASTGTCTAQRTRQADSYACSLKYLVCEFGH